MGYKVLAPEVTVHRRMRELIDSEGNPRGWQLGLGRTYTEGDIIPDEEMNPKMVEALEDESHPSHDYVSALVEQSSDKQQEGPAAPFAGYDDLDADTVLQVMRNLPSASIRSWIAYEAANANRPEIVNYSIGFGESPALRQQGAVSSTVPDDHAPEEKPSAQRVTRQTPPPADQIVVPGEGVTGTGEGRIDHETAEALASAAGTDDSDDDGDDEESKPKRRTRRTSRRSDS